MMRRKEIRRCYKEEKRIIKLLYRKGLLNETNLSNLYWEELRYVGNGRCYQYISEMHLGWTDYWGEGDSKSIIDIIKEEIYWANIDGEEEHEGEYYPVSSLKINTRSEFIKYLTKLPTIRRDSKINELLLMSNDY